MADETGTHAAYGNSAGTLRAPHRDTHPARPACRRPSAIYAMTVRFSFDQIIRHPLAKVYPYLAEPRNRPAWQSTLHRVDMLTEGPPGLGTRWREKAIGFGTSEMEIVAFEPHRVWGERARSPVGEATITLRFAEETSDPPITRVRVEVDIVVPRLLGPPARLVMTRLFRNDLARAERLLRSA